MSNIGTLSESLPCGGKLNVSETQWSIDYYFPGPDRRYNGTHTGLSGTMVFRYIDALNENWNEFKKISASLPEGSELSKVGILSMRIEISNYFKGIYLFGNILKLPISSEEQFKRIIESYKYALLRSPQMLDELFKSAGLIRMKPEEQAAAFSKYLKTHYIEINHTNPRVEEELKFVIKAVKSRISAGSTVLQHRVNNWFGKAAAEDFMDEIREYGLNVRAEGANFIITWKLVSPT